MRPSRRPMRYSCTTCDAVLNVASAAPARDRLPCPSCGGELAAEAKVFHLPTDRDPTRRYDLDELKARLQAEKEAVAALAQAPSSRTPEQVWFVGVQGRQVGPLTAAGLSGLRTRGHLAAATLVWKEGFPAWVAAEAVAELRPLLGLPEALPSLPFPDEPTSPAVHAPVPLELAAAAALPSPPELEAESIDSVTTLPPDPLPATGAGQEPSLGAPAGGHEITKVARKPAEPPVVAVEPQAGERIYDPTVGTSATQTLTGVALVPLTLSYHPLIIEIPSRTGRASR